MEKTDMEKDGAESIEDVKRNSNGDAGSPSSIINRYSDKEVSRIKRKIDFRLIPVIGFMYCISLLDRTNLSNAAIAGMYAELRLNLNSRYSIITLVFFITYVLFQPPATVIIRKIGPRLFLSSITFLWGLVMLGMGFAEDWSTLVGLRFILGIFEAGFFPGSVYLLSTWYVRYDVGKRYAFFYMIGMLASALGGILAFGIQQMNGVAGYGGWRWIFILEGILTCVIGVIGYFTLVSFPDDMKNKKNSQLLTGEEIDLVIARVQQDRGDAHVERFNMRNYLSAGLDLKIWAYGTIFGALTTVAYALAYFLPIILRDNLGFSIALSQCLVAPPYAFAALFMLVTSWISDRYHQRGAIIAFNAGLTIIGLSLLGFAPSNPVRYFGVFLTTAGANSSIPITLAYQANNIRGQWKRAFCSATLVGTGGIGGIIGSTVFRSQDAPEYIPGISVAIGSQVLILILVGLLSVAFVKQNSKADKGRIIIEGGDEHFRYTL